MVDTTSLEAATERTAEIPHGPIHYRELGQGEPVVFIHGLLVNGLLWRKVVPPLAASHRCIVPDLPLGSHRTPMNAGADLSPPGLAAAVGAFIEALDLRDVTLIANDTGGALCQILAASRPERIGRLVLTSCDMFDNFLPPAFRPLQWVGSWTPSLTVVLQAMRIEAVRNSPLGFGLVAKRPIERAVTDRYLHCALHSPQIRRDVAKVLRGIDARHTIAAAKRLHGFDRPTLLAWATEDRVFPPAHARRMAELLANPRVEWIEDSYAFVPEDQPAALAELIDDFLRDTTPQKKKRTAAN